MTVQNDTNVKTYTGNGVTTVFPYDFFIPGDSTTDQANVEVTLLEISTGIEGDPLADVLWSITGVGEDTYGNVTYTGGGTPLPATHKINIRRVVPYEQNLDLTTQSAYFPELLEEQLDLMVYQIQQLAEETARSVKVAIGSEDDPDALVQGVLDALEDTQAAATSAAASAVAAAASEVAADASADFAAASVASIGTSVADAAASAAAAAASETAAETAETNAETAAASAASSAAAASTSETNAATSATAAQTAETNAETAEVAAEAAQVAAEAAQAAAEAAAGALTPVEDQIVAAAVKATPVAADLFGIVDSENSSNLAQLSWGDLKALLDTLYQAVGGGAGIEVGTVVDYVGVNLPALYLWAAGQTISRATYADYWAAVHKEAVVTLAIASPGVVGWNAHGFRAGDPVRFYNSGGALPTGVASNTTYFVISAGLATDSFRIAATVGGAAINFTGAQSGVHTGVYAPYGHGDGSTTCGVPDLRGRVGAGRDDMGGASANRLTSPATTLNGLDGDVLGNVGGSETHTLTTAQLASHAHTFTVASGAGGSSWPGSNTSTTTSTSTGSAGSDQAHNNVQPTLIVNKIIYVGV